MNFSKYTPDGTYSISHIDLTDRAGNWKAHYVSDVSVDLVNPNSDSVLPSLDSFEMRAVYDDATNRPKIIIEGLVIDELAGFKETLVGFDGPQGATYNGLGWEHDSDPSLNFKIELNLLNEYTPGTYTINTVYIYDNAYNRITDEDIDFDFLNSPTSIHVYFPTSDEMTQVDGSEADDFVFGSNNTDDTLEAGAGDDYLFAGEGDDIVDGGDGDDLIIGGNGAGDDYYKGGDGIDTVKYTSATDGITVNLTTGTATSTNGSDAAGIGTDTLVGIENIIGGNFDDILTGSSGANTIQGVAGSDLIDGAAGNDTITLTGNTNHDGKFAHNVSSSLQVATDVRINLSGKVKLETVVDGGADADTVNLSSNGDAFFLHDTFSGFHSSLTLTTDTHTGAQSTQRIMNVETINGLDGDDIIDLTSPDYSLAGQIITINGGLGNDAIWGSDATETLIGGEGNDILFGGSGNDTLTGGAGADTFEFTVTAASDTITDYSKSEGDILKFYKRDQYEGDQEASISAGVVTFGSVTIDLGDTSLNSLDVLNVEYAII